MDFLIGRVIIQDLLIQAWVAQCEELQNFWYGREMDLALRQQSGSGVTTRHSIDIPHSDARYMGVLINLKFPINLRPNYSHIGKSGGPVVGLIFRVPCQCSFVVAGPRAFQLGVDHHRNSRVVSRGSDT